MLKERILLPGITVLTRLVRKAENDRLYALLSGRLSSEMRTGADGAVTRGRRPRVLGAGPAAHGADQGLGSARRRYGFSWCRCRRPSSPTAGAAGQRALDAG
ncbi:hypothetical protein [Streptosporangium vulgare]|uniref:hypothetical protein n=1 Tax=Streptosporangium vulgare TaxID=46190 RepID=UPI0031DC3E24